MMFRKNWREALRRADIGSAQRARWLGVHHPAADERAAQDKLLRMKAALRQKPDGFTRR